MFLSFSVNQKFKAHVFVFFCITGGGMGSMSMDRMGPGFDHVGMSGMDMNRGFGGYGGGGQMGGVMSDRGSGSKGGCQIFVRNVSVGCMAKGSKAAKMSFSLKMFLINLSAKYFLYNFINVFILYIREALIKSLLTSVSVRCLICQFQFRSTCYLIC